MSEILKELIGEASGRAVEAVLINNAYAEALDRLAHSLAAESGLAEDDSAIRRPAFISEATLDHQSVHSAATEERMSALLQAVEKALSAASGKGLRIVELGTVSPAFTRRLAALAAAHDAVLTLVEPRENAQRNLELTFEQDAQVRVLKKDDFKTIGPIDLVVSGSDSFFPLMDEDTVLRGAVRNGLSAKGALVAVIPAPTVFSDFTLGLTDDWFARSQSPEFPIGRLASVPQWQKCLGDLGLTAISVEDRETTYGTVIALEARGAETTQPALTDPSGDGAGALPLLFASCNIETGLPGAEAHPLLLTGDLETDKTKLTAALQALHGRRCVPSISLRKRMTRQKPVRPRCSSG